jgi:GNAT superfamily N-acetyltransferase
VRAPDPIAIRHIQPEDKPRLVAAFRGLEPQSIYRRFFFPKKEVSDQELRRLTEPDRTSEAVLVATTGPEERIVGLGTYTGDRKETELAFIVEEDYQGRGIAKALLRRLADLAHENGITRLSAHVLAANGPMLSVLRQSGLPVVEREADGVVTVTLLVDGLDASDTPCTDPTER